MTSTAAASANEVSFSALEAALDTLALFQSMFPLDDELKIGPSTVSQLPDLQELLDSFESGEANMSAVKASFTSVDFTLAIPLEDEEQEPLELHVQLPLRGSDIEDQCIPSPQLQIRQPPFFNRSQHSALCNSLEDFVQEQVGLTSWTPSDLILGAIDNVKDTAAGLRKESAAEREVELEPEETLGALQRTWFWFPSLSSKEKRQDFVDYSHEFKLTGFVMAGE